MTSCDSSTAPGAVRDTLRALDKAYLWFWPELGGGAPTAPADSHSVAGRGGEIDSFTQRGAGLYWIEITNFLTSGRRGRSCSSNQARVTGATSGVPVAAVVDSIECCRLFAVTGALISTVPAAAWYCARITPEQLSAWTHRRVASGVYFLRCTSRAGAVLKRKVPVLR